MKTKRAKKNAKMGRSWVEVYEKIQHVQILHMLANGGENSGFPNFPLPRLPFSLLDAVAGGGVHFALYFYKKRASICLKQGVL